MSERREPTVSSNPSNGDLEGRRRQRPNPRPTPSQRVEADRKASSSGFVWFTFLLTLVSMAGVAYLVWQLQLAQNTISDQSVRIIQLENKLALSDDSANQSLASVSVKMKELNAQVTTNVSEVDKLWAARNVLRTASTDQAEKIEGLEKIQKSLETVPKKLSAIEASVRKTDQSLKSQSTSIAATSQRIQEQDILLQSVREKLSTQEVAVKAATDAASKVDSLSARVDNNSAVATKLTATVNSVDKRVKTNEEAITAFDAFRRTVSRDLLQLKQPQ